VIRGCGRGKRAVTASIEPQSIRRMWPAEVAVGPVQRRRTSDAARPVACASAATLPGRLQRRRPAVCQPQPLGVRLLGRFAAAIFARVLERQLYPIPRLQLRKCYRRAHLRPGFQDSRRVNLGATERAAPATLVPDDRGHLDAATQSTRKLVAYHGILRYRATECLCPLGFRGNRIVLPRFKFEASIIWICSR
jgi:hypothetical protein